MKESDWRWYVEPVGRKAAYTNEVISRMLAATRDAAGSEERDLIDSTGRMFNAWRVTYTIVNQLGGMSDISFRVFAQERKDATIREWKFGLRRRQPKKVNDLEDQVAALKERIQFGANQR